MQVFRFTPLYPMLDKGRQNGALNCKEVTCAGVLNHSKEVHHWMGTHGDMEQLYNYCHEVGGYSCIELILLTQCNYECHSLHRQLCSLLLHVCS